ncbi:hypothetical protein H2198_009776 [Neophaeococcomyces mojaviensis]|uniref:Uncharacterized protein n=1 Tax=Neophaeococcomyces mojaviensis TaxID=3383035 RepID=A0ACC2ZU40_9EURO|nr:hypothetical protein H2198_009776 [Knufia sp. JES_112]
MEHEIAILEQNVHVWKQDLVSKEDSSNANDTTNPQADEPIDQTSNNKEPEQRDQGPTMMSRVREAEKAHLELMSMILDDDLCQRYYDEIHKHIRVLTTIRPLNAAHSANWTETDFQKFRKSYSEEAMSMKNYMDILRLRKEREDFEKELPQRLLARMMADLELSPIRKTHKDHTIDEDEDVDEDEDENEDEEETEGESDRQVSISPPPSSAEDPNYSDPDNPYAAFQKTPTFIPPAYYKSQSQTKPKPTSLPVSQPNFTHPLPAKPPGPNPSTWETITMRQKRMTQRPQQINVFRAEAANETRKTATVVFGRDSWRLKHAEPKSAGDAHQRFAAHQALWRKEKEVKPFGLRDWRTRPADNVKEAKPRTAGSESGVEWTLVKSRKSLRRESVDG